MKICSKSLDDSEGAPPGRWCFCVCGRDSHGRVRVSKAIVMNLGDNMPEDWVTENPDKAQAIINAGAEDDLSTDRFAANELLEMARSELATLDSLADNPPSSRSDTTAAIAILAAQNRSLIRTIRRIALLINM